MKTDIKATFTILLDPVERERLTWLARESGRTPSGVVRRLAALAYELPEYRRALGILPTEESNQAAEVTG